MPAQVQRQAVHDDTTAPLPPHPVAIVATASPLAHTQHAAGTDGAVGSRMRSTTGNTDTFEQAILAEAAARDARALQASEPCLHEDPDMIVYGYTSIPWEDHTTTRGYCRRCGQWVVRTDSRRGLPSESRVMTEIERDWIRAREDRYRRLESL